MTVVIASLVVRPIAVVGPIVMILRRVLLRLRVLVAGRLRPAPLGTRWMGLAGLAPLVVALRPARRAVLGAVALAGFRRRAWPSPAAASRPAPAWVVGGGVGVAVGRGLGVGRGFFVGGRGRRRRRFHGSGGRPRRSRAGGSARGVASVGMLGVGSTLGVGSALADGGGTADADGSTPVDGSGVLPGPPDPAAPGVGVDVPGAVVGVACPGGAAWAVGGGTTAMGAVGLFWNPIPSATDASTRLTRPRASTSRSRCAPVTLVLTPTPRGECSPEPPPRRRW